MSFVVFWREQRTSSRLAFLLQMLTRVLNAIFGLLWTRLLVFAMGDKLFGVFSWFQSVAALGGLGDLGLGAIVALRVGRHLGERDRNRLTEFLATARALFATMALLLLGAGIAISPWAASWLAFAGEAANVGSHEVLFCLGASSAALLVVASYVNNLNYAVGNLTWPVLPGFVVTQSAALAHWLLARANAPLTTQYIPYVIASAVLLIMSWWFVRVSHPELAIIVPLRARARDWVHLAGQSFWSYLWSVGNGVYLNIATLLIGPAFGAAEVTRYRVNGKLSELAFFVVVTAGTVALPKLTQWMASPLHAEKQRAIEGLRRLNQMQGFLGCSAAVIYLAFNDAFVRVWMSPGHRVPIEWQWAFALSLSITACSAAAIQIATRCGDNGLRYSGSLVGVTAALNLVLSFAAMKGGTILGIAFAGVVAQSFFSIVIGRFVCRFFQEPLAPFLLRNLIFPSALVTVAFFVRKACPPTFGGYAVVTAVVLLLIGIAARLTGISLAFIRSEIGTVAGIFGRGKP